MRPKLTAAEPRRLTPESSGFRLDTRNRACQRAASDFPPGKVTAGEAFANRLSLFWSGSGVSPDAG
jgi:hypothetical protein